MNYILKYKTPADKDFKNLATYTDGYIASERFTELVGDNYQSHSMNGYLEGHTYGEVKGRMEIIGTYRLIKNN